MPPRTTSVGDRLSAAWLRHPVVAFLRHRKRITFLHQLHALVRAGIPIPTAFEQLLTYAPDERMAQGLRRVARDVRQGATLGDALRTHSALFEDASVELIAFAEEAGKLESVLASLTAHLEQVQRQRWRAIMSALWPLYLAAAAIFVGPLLSVPQAMTPGASVGALYVGGLVQTLSMSAGMVSLVLGVPFLAAALGREEAWDRLLYRLPMVGAPRRLLAAARVVLGLGLANQAGMEMVRSLRLAARTTASPAVLGALPAAEEKLRQGSTLTEAVAALDVLDRSSLGTLSVAETTGTLDTTLQRLSEELSQASLRAMRLLTILVTGVVAVAVLAKIVVGLLGVILGPIKSFYDAAGSGKLD